MSGVNHGDGDLVFASWLLKDQKSEKLERLKSQGCTDAKAALDKLHEMAERGRAFLKQRHFNQAATFGKGIAKMRVTLDPD